MITILGQKKEKNKRTATKKKNIANINNEESVIIRNTNHEKKNKFTGMNFFFNFENE